jgi:hypothetical protein
MLACSVHSGAMERFQQQFQRRARRWVEYPDGAALVDRDPFLRALNAYFWSRRHEAAEIAQNSREIGHAALTALALADDGERRDLSQQWRSAERSRRPIDEILQYSRDRVIIFGKHPAQRIRLGYRATQSIDRGGRIVMVQIFIVMGQLAEPLIDRDSRSSRRELL